MFIVSGHPVLQEAVLWRSLGTCAVAKTVFLLVLSSLESGSPFTDELQQHRYGVTLAANYEEIRQ